MDDPTFVLACACANPPFAVSAYDVALTEEKAGNPKSLFVAVAKAVASPVPVATALLVAVALPFGPPKGKPPTPPIAVAEAVASLVPLAEALLVAVALPPAPPPP